MPTIPLHISPLSSPAPIANPLPELLHTPSGLALVEIQGTLNMPDQHVHDDDNNDDDEESMSTAGRGSTHIGKFVFAPTMDAASGKQRVWLYVGRHQRLSGEVRKLPTPLAVLRRRGGIAGAEVEELEIAEVVRYKVVFSQRPEPVTDQMVGM